MVQMGSILGALIACVITGKLYPLTNIVWTMSNTSQDRIGRVWATRELCLVWAFGIGIFMAASKTGNVGMVLGGRFLAGVGIGKYPNA